VKLSKSLKQSWADIISASSEIPIQERQVLEAYFYIGAMTTVGILNNENNNLDEDLARLERSLIEMNEKILKPADITQYH